jgi:hypothetical protein
VLLRPQIGSHARAVEFFVHYTDGMQQNRCLLPWYGHRKPPPVHLKQHLQGILMHGRQLRVYRSFSNVCVNANFCVHTWLLSLEEQYRKGKLPPTLYHQIDGGSENANVLYLAICFMLVAKGLCLKVVLTRLLPGHTHEDIDALFALIWQMVKDEIVLTPSEFEAAILKAFKKLKDVKVEDIHAVPNYTKYFEGYCDADVSRFAKEDWTQLQMTFERVGEDERDRYPLGVKMTYKAYSQDEAIEIVDDPAKESITGLIPQLTLCPVCPSEDEPPICIMKSLPPSSRSIEVDPFIAGSREFTVACADRMQRSYADKQPEVSAEWAKWRDEVSPKTDIATDYIAEHPLHIPFLAELFSGAAMSGYEVDARQAKPRRVVGGKEVLPMRVVTANSSMTHSGAKASKSSKPPRTVLETADGEDVADQNLSARAHIVVNPKKPRSKKAAPEQNSTQKKPSQKKAVPKKKKVVEDSASEEEGQDCEEECEDGKDDDDEEDVDADGNIAVFKVGDKVKNSAGLRGTVEECHENGTYSVLYNDGGRDMKLPPSLMTALPTGMQFLITV